ncbi:MAG: flavodoxin domain-containing protein [Planctomycetota bacterium]|nr:flavodoxin domain-containing protein [Planctomycetota bacterium]
MGAFNAVKITDKVYWVGAIDWGIRDFHGYLTTRGTTYNAYLVLADKVTLVDTVKKPFFCEMMERIKSVIEPQKIAYIVSNHSEIDHSGALTDAISVVKPEKVFASVNGVENLRAHFHEDLNLVAVKDGEKLNLGDANILFVETKMLHWPDSMASYLIEEKVLFSQDGFGMHLATGERFADEISEEILCYEATKYYANILLPFSSLILRLIERIKSLGIEIRILAPDHGPIWRKEIDKIVGWYASFAEQKRARKAVVVYDTMWGSTARMGSAICEGLISCGVSVKQMSLKSCHRSDVVTELLDAGAIAVGSPTLNNGVFPTVADLLTYIKGLKMKNLLGVAFGSYGWSGEALKILNESLSQAGILLVSDGVKVRFVPGEGALKECYSLGVLVGENLRRRY